VPLRVQLLSFEPGLQRLLIFQVRNLTCISILRSDIIFNIIVPLRVQLLSFEPGLQRLLIFHVRNLTCISILRSDMIFNIINTMSLLSCPWSRQVLPLHAGSFFFFGDKRALLRDTIRETSFIYRHAQCLQVPLTCVFNSSVRPAVLPISPLI